VPRSERRGKRGRNSASARQAAFSPRKEREITSTCLHVYHYQKRFEEGQHEGHHVGGWRSYRSERGKPEKEEIALLAIENKGGEEKRKKVHNNSANVKRGQKKKLAPTCAAEHHPRHLSQATKKQRKKGGEEGKDARLPQ